VADIVWERFGNVPNYCEPFFGSGAVLLARPFTPGIETVNDLDCYLANFWRALQSDPDAVAAYADWPVNEVDQHARHLWLVSQADFRERMKTDPDFYDSQIAGWWIWGQCCWIGSGWCQQYSDLGDAGTGIHRKLPHLGDAGRGIHRQRPHLGDAGTGIHRQRPELGASDILKYMRQLADRMRRVRVCCGNWDRILGPTPTFKHGTTGVFLDPPYSDQAERTENLYTTDDLKIAHEVREWAIANGNNPELRIALCGYENEHRMPDSWECIAWKTAGGYGSQGNNRARQNSERERIWFSPHCLNPQYSLFHITEPIEEMQMA
jgi:site-specific DNA-adenine methylase